MASLLIQNVRIVEPGKGIGAGDVLVNDGCIAAVGSVDRTTAAGAAVVDGGGRLLTPGLIDVHTHGVLLHSYDSGAASLVAAARALARYGVTTVVPTLVPPSLGPGSKGAWLKKLKTIVDAIPSAEGVHIPGIHLEGPFLAIAGAACATMDGDLGLLEDLLRACEGRIRIMSVSPETPNILPVIHRLRERGIAVFLTHTRASVAATIAAIDAGALHATHFYDVFYAPAEADPGVRPVGAVEAILADPRATVDFIADGVHVDPMAIRAAVAAKTWAGVTLITDSNVGTGLPPGVHETPWGYAVRTAPEGAARHAVNGTLAGSTLTMNRGIANLLVWLDLPPEQIWAMGTLNPARL